MKTSMSIDGWVILFEEVAPGVLRLSLGDDGRTIGTLHWSPEERSYRAQTADDRELTHPSQWLGRVRARFGSREIGARALLAQALGYSSD